MSSFRTRLVEPLHHVGARMAQFVAAGALAPEALVAAAGVAVSAGGEADGPQPVNRVQLLPIGEVRLNDGRGPFHVRDRAHAERIVAASLARAGKARMFIDYDHALLRVLERKPNAKAPAAAWLDRVRVEDDGVWADVEWTPAAADAIRAGEYSYLSPLFAHDAKTGDVELIINAGLVNGPAITDLAPVAASQELEVDLTKIMEALGLAVGATVEDALSAIAALKEAGGTMSAVAAALALDAGAQGSAIVAAAATAHTRATAPDPAKFVPIEHLTAANTQLAALQGEKVDGLVAAALEAGKIVAAQQDWAKGFAKTDPAGFAGWVEAAPVVVAAGSIMPGGKPKPAAGAGKGADGLDDEERDIARSLGLSPENFLKAKG